MILAVALPLHSLLFVANTLPLGNGDTLEVMDTEVGRVVCWVSDYELATPEHVNAITHRGCGISC